MIQEIVVGLASLLCIVPSVCISMWFHFHKDDLSLYILLPIIIQGLRVCLFQFIDYDNVYFSL
jgi:hypothetical protein